MVIFERFLPTVFKTRLKLRRLQAKFPGREILSTAIWPTAKLGLECSIGEGVVVGDGVEIGDYSYVNRGSMIGSGKIGRFCSIAYGCQIGMQQHPLHRISTSSRLYGARSILNSRLKTNEFPNPPVIGHDVWIGSNACIMQGVEIGNGAVIAAGAVVTKNVGPYEIVAGVPARPIRKRFDDETIRFLLEWQWWNLPIEKLREYDKVLTSDDWRAELLRATPEAELIQR